MIQAKEIKLVKLKDIKLNPNNRNKHPDEQIDRIVDIIKYQGFRRPGTISNRSGLLVCGEGRYLAAKKLGLKEMPIMFQDYESEEQEYADGIADNALDKWAALDLSEINNDLLNFSDDFDVDVLGLKDFETVLPEVFEPQADEDEVPEQVDTRCKLGDVWTLGRHRLMCGDSTVITDIEQLLGGTRVDLTFTSPPYGVGLEYNSYDDSFDNTLSVVQSVLLTSSKVTDGYIALNWGDIVSGKEINKSAHPSQYSWLPIYDRTLKELGFFLWAQRIWKKPHARVSAPWAASSNRNVTDWEYLFTWSNGKQRSNSRQNDSHFGVIDSSESSQSDTLKDHPGAFPVMVAERMVAIHTENDFAVLDPFGGSGSTLIACEKTNRKCFMMELDPHYCDVILSRWEKYTGKIAERIGG